VRIGRDPTAAASGVRAGSMVTIVVGNGTAGAIHVHRALSNEKCSTAAIDDDRGGAVR